MSSILTPERLKQLLDEYDVPNAFSHFSTPQTPPFITWTCPQTDNFNADNLVYEVIPSLQIELYSRVDILNEEKALETYLTGKGLLWDKTSETWIDEEKVMMTIYEVS